MPLIYNNKKKQINPKEIMDKEDKNKNLFPVRCPFQRLSKSDGKLYRCNSLCARLEPLSKGQLRCRKCRLSFDFDVNTVGVVDTYVNTKPIK